MNICINCGVELENDMQQCPLCGTPVGEDHPDSSPGDKSRQTGTHLTITGTIKSREKSLLQRIVWQVTSIILLSAIISTLIIDVAVHKQVTWAAYPVTISMIVFTYASLFAFWHTKRIYQILAGLLISSLLFIVLDLLQPQSNWQLRLGLPILIVINLIGIILIMVINLTKHRGLNVIAYTCVAIAGLCMTIESILSYYHNEHIVLRWSIIVAACLLPVTAALIFMHHRIKRNPEIEKIFHT